MTKSQRAPRDWYRISVDTLRLGIGTVVVIVLSVGAVFGYRYWDEQTMEQRAYEVLDRARNLAKRLEAEDGVDAYRTDYDKGVEQMTKARSALEKGSFPDALLFGEESLRTLRLIQNSLRNQGKMRVASFTSVQGDVEYQRGEKGDFAKARPRDVLYEGDWVRSSGQGSAEILFDEGTLFTVGPNALFKLNRRRALGGKSTIGVMEYGWASVNTAQRDSRVGTKFAELRVQQNSQATLSVPENSDRGRFVVNRGGAEIKSSTTGEVRKLKELEQVEERQGRLGKAIPVPKRPELLDPPDNYTIDIDRNDEVELAWAEVEGAARYALQVSRSRLFGDNIIDVENRRSTTAKLGVQSEGNFVWRVAALAKNGLQGPWSSPRKFRIASFGGVDLEQDTTPPHLELEVIANGNILIVQGSTEPGAKLAMNDDVIPVGADGRFRSSIVLQEEGRVTLVFRATDGAGNPTVVTRQILLESL